MTLDRELGLALWTREAASVQGLRRGLFIIISTALYQNYPLLSITRRRRVRLCNRGRPPRKRG